MATYTVRLSAMGIGSKDQMQHIHRTPKILLVENTCGLQTKARNAQKEDLLIVRFPVVLKVHVF